MARRDRHSIPALGCSICLATVTHENGENPGDFSSTMQHAAGCINYASGPPLPTPNIRRELLRARNARPCDQLCGNVATVYAMGSGSGDWGGFYCEPCAKALRFVITDRLNPAIEAERDR
jgi:hypothetical protein